MPDCQVRHAPNTEGCAGTAEAIITSCTLHEGKYACRPLALRWEKSILEGRMRCRHRGRLHPGS